VGNLAALNAQQMDPAAGGALQNAAGLKLGNRPIKRGRRDIEISRNRHQRALSRQSAFGVCEIAQPGQNPFGQGGNCPKLEQASGRHQRLREV
jgi:hypothetical protein